MSGRFRGSLLESRSVVRLSIRCMFRGWLYFLLTFLMVDNLNSRHTNKRFISNNAKANHRKASGDLESGRHSDHRVT